MISYSPKPEIYMFEFADAAARGAENIIDHAKVLESEDHFFKLLAFNKRGILMMDFARTESGNAYFAFNGNGMTETSQRSIADRISRLDGLTKFDNDYKYRLANPTLPTVNALAQVWMQETRDPIVVKHIFDR